jgi:predicted flap endonuclease-1-like 5' DNA nuclease
VSTASRRARRLGGLLLVVATVLWAFMRRRANAVRWVEPPATTLPTGLTRPTGMTRPAAADEPGTPGELPDEVLATDAGLTELPEAAAEGPTDAVEELPAETVDETRVAEILAESPDADVVVVDEASYEQAVADAAPEPSPAEATVAEAEVVAAGPAAAEPGDETTEAELEDTAAEPGDETTEAELEDAAAEQSLGVAMPTFSEAPTAEIPAVTDDLRRIRGIGPSMERKLQGIGIVSYRQLALLDGAELERVRAELTDFRGRIEREDWAGQARALYREKYGRDPA